MLTSLPNGLRVIINFGSKVRTDIIASNIAIPVNIPKYIVGIKLDNIKIEKPKQKAIITLLINYDEFCISNKCHISIINKTKN